MGLPKSEPVPLNSNSATAASTSADDTAAAMRQGVSEVDSGRVRERWFNEGTAPQRSPGGKYAWAHVVGFRAAVYKNALEPGPNTY